MAVKVKVAGPLGHIVKHKLFTIFVLLVATAAVVFAAIFGFYYFKYKQIVDARLSKPLFTDTAKIYAAPFEVRPGQKIDAAFVAHQLAEAGYTPTGENPASTMGTYTLAAGAITVNPGPDSYHAPDSATISFANGTVTQILGQNGEQLAAYQLEPLLITGLSDSHRIKRRLITYNQLPPYLIPAVTAIEDRRFFKHGGLDYWGILRSALNDIRPGHTMIEGASTIDMQVAKMFFLTPQRTFRRKFLQVVVTEVLEQKLDKQQIFQLYANQVPLGQRGSFSINGFGEAAQAFFGKNVSQLNLDECALLAGLIQSPSWLNPMRHPQRATIRRNEVLDAMVETGAITATQAAEAKAQPIRLIPRSVDAGEAPYFVDLVRDQLAQRLGNDAYNDQGLRIYTSLDPQLQQIAAQAVAWGMKHVDDVVRRQHDWKVRYAERNHLPIPPLVLPQVALVALDPHTGQVLALVGGKDYGQSQLNHAIVFRPTGSTFKPFVFATAFNSSLAGTPLTSLSGTSGIFSPVTILNDEPTTFITADGQTYSPHDFEDKYFGLVTARVALMKSLNNATIELAQMVGIKNVIDLAHQAGLTQFQPTLSAAIGAYGASPLQMAGAYTIFANGGIKEDPWMLASVRTANGNVIANYTNKSTPVLDPRVAFLTTTLMEAVINHGTAAGARSQYGFMAPAAGKTGTENDSWFSGYTSNLLCVVWVGNDNYSVLHMEGATAALPIWAAFMKAAIQLPQYSDVKDFTPPPGVVEETLDNNTNLLADQSCPDDYTAWFLNGTQPTETCDHINGNQQNIFERIFGIGPKKAATAPEQTPSQPASQPQSPESVTVPTTTPTTPEAGGGQPKQQQQAQPQQEHKKRGFWARLFGHGQNNPPPESNQQNPQP